MDDTERIMVNRLFFFVFAVCDRVTGQLSMSGLDI